jgi:hypothetical protein
MREKRSSGAMAGDFNRAQLIETGTGSYRFKRMVAAKKRAKDL